jgi:hypothetical protein
MLVKELACMANISTASGERNSLLDVLFIVFASDGGLSGSGHSIQPDAPFLTLISLCYHLLDINSGVDEAKGSC